MFCGSSSRCGGGGVDLQCMIVVFSYHTYILYDMCKTITKLANIWPIENKHYIMLNCLSELQFLSIVNREIMGQPGSLNIAKFWHKFYCC